MFKIRMKIWKSVFIWKIRQLRCTAFCMVTVGQGCSLYFSELGKSVPVYHNLFPPFRHWGRISVATSHQVCFAAFLTFTWTLEVFVFAAIWYVFTPAITCNCFIIWLCCLLLPYFHALAEARLMSYVVIIGVVPRAHTFNTMKPFRLLQEAIIILCSLIGVLYSDCIIITHHTVS